VTSEITLNIPYLITNCLHILHLLLNICSFRLHACFSFEAWWKVQSVVVSDVSSVVELRLYIGTFIVKL